MQADFEIAWKKHLDSQKHLLTTEQYENYSRFALSNRSRGKAFLESLQRVFPMDFSGRRVMDIGSAYAGFSIECAKRGAQSYGIEIADYLHELALINIEGEDIDIHLVHGDFLNENVLDSAGDEPFDLIVINDVFEHVFDIDLLFRRIQKHCGPNTILSFAIPNGESYHMIENEGHKFVFGLSILEPGLWAKVVGPFNIYYRSFQIYKFFFRYIGLKNIYLEIEKHKINSAPDRVLKKLNEIGERIRNHPFEDNDVNVMMKQKLFLLEQKIHYDIANLTPQDIHVMYEMHFWKGYATSVTHVLNPDSSVVCY